MTDCNTTVVVLSYNNKSVTEKFIELLFANTPKFKLIMIDNGSTDGTVEYLDSTLSVSGNPYFADGHVTFVANQENLGVIGGRNMGFTLYQSDPTEFLCFLDNDQFVGKGWLAQYHEFMNANNLDIAGADAWLMDSSFMPRVNCKKQGDPYSYVGCGGMMMRKKVVDEVGIFDERFNPAYFEDPDYNFRARQKNFRIGWNLNAKITHLPHQTLGKNEKRMKIFAESFNKFQKKWAGIKFVPLR